MIIRYHGYINKENIGDDLIYLSVKSLFGYIDANV